jgi:polar amino acid transport system substrate-binding protein
MNQRMFTILRAGLAPALLASSLVACSASTAHKAAPSNTTIAATVVDSAARALLPDAIRQSNTIEVASSIGFAPFEFYGPDGTTPDGLDVDLIHAIEPILGVTFKINDVRYPNILPSLQAKRYDIGWSAFGENPEAAKVVDFATYLTASSGAVLVSATANIKSGTDLCGKSMGQVGGEPLDNINAINDMCTKANKPAVTSKMFQKTADIVLALESGQLDARASGSANGGYIAARSGGKLTLLKNVLPPVTSSVGVAALKGQGALLSAIAKALQDLVNNGKYGAILAKWFASDGAVPRIATSTAT